jgi:hypothetical protein
MDDHTVAYHYHPIVSNDEIRVLRLDPGSFDDPLVTSMFSRTITIEVEASNLDYDCVSYCWGPPKDFRLLRCDDQHLRITAVVEDVLRHLRKPTKPRNLWVDAGKYQCCCFDEKS